MTTNAIDIALLGLRAVLGLVFVAHGVKHVANRAKTISWTESIGFRRPALQWAFMSGGEIAIGVGLAAGALTSFAVAGLVAMMLVAFWTVHRHAGFWITARPDEGYEYVLVLAVAATALAVLGPGSVSVDHALGIADDLDGVAGGLIAAGGLAAGTLQLLAFHRPGSVS